MEVPNKTLRPLLMLGVHLSLVAAISEPGLLPPAAPLVVAAPLAETHLAADLRCSGFGGRLEASLLRLQEGRAVARPGSAVWLLYKSFLRRVLKAFTGRSDWLMATLAYGRAWLSAFAAEAERWVDRLWSAKVPKPLTVGTGNNSVSSGSGSSSSSSSSVIGITNSSSGVGGNNETSANTSSLMALGTEADTASTTAPSCLQHLYSLMMSRLDPRPASFIREPPEGRSNGVVLLSGSDRVAAMSESVVENHAEFARRNGYVYWWHRGSLVAELGWQPYWHKIAQLIAASRHFRNASAFVWVDDDIVMTNHAGTDMIQEALRRDDASVLVTRDPSRAATLNTGIMIVRNDAAGRQVLEELWRRATARRADGVSLAKDPQSRCLHEQQALQEMVWSGEWQRQIAVLDQRDSSAASALHLVGGERAFNLNTFLRWSHYNAERAEEARFEGDAHGSGWLQGDFAGHCSGLSPLRRALCVAVLVDAVKR